MYKGETKTRDTLRRLTGHRFPKSRRVLPGGKELDGFCEELGIAFEYDGEQHYKYVPHFHRNGKIDLYRQKGMDLAKDAWCEQLLIVLIRVRYDVADIEAYLREELELLGVLKNGA
jgi:hypothetical protein